MLTSGNWILRVNQKVLGDGYVTFPKAFLNTVTVLGTTTNVNPRNVVGYISHILKIPSIGDCEFEERFTLTNEYPKIITFPQSESYYLRFRFASPVGNCWVKIWEYTQ